MDARLQALQDTLVMGLIPLENIMGKVGESIDNKGDLPTKEVLWEHLSNSLLLIAEANHNLNICRRDMFKSDLDDKYKVLCNNKKSVGSELFRDDLAERLKTVPESNNAAKKLTKAKTPSKKVSKPFYLKGDAKQESLCIIQQPDHPSREVPEEQQIPSKGVTKDNSQEPRADCEAVIIQPKVNKNPLLIIGGRIKGFFNHWKKLTNDPTILNIVKGYKVEFVGPNPIQLGNIRPTVLNYQESQNMASLLNDFLERGIIRPSQHELTEFISPVFLREKKNGSLRLILNLREFNNFVAPYHFKMDNIEACICSR